MGLGIAIELDRNRGQGQQGAIRRFKGIETRVDDFSPVLQKIGKSFRTGEKRRFTTQGGGTWAPLTAKTLKAKARAGQDVRILRATDELYRALTTGKGPGAVNEISKDSAAFGTDLKAAIFAQRGSGRRRRRLVVVDKRRRARWTTMIRKYILELGK